MIRSDTRTSDPQESDTRTMAKTPTTTETPNWIVTTWVVMVILFTASSAENLAAEEIGFPIQTSVRQIQSADSQAEPSMEMTPGPTNQPPPPTLPGGKLPQYQLGRDARLLPTPEQQSDPHVRMFVAMKNHLLLLDARISVDGHPFRIARKKRVAKLLEVLNQERNDDSTAADSPAKEDVAEEEKDPDQESDAIGLAQVAPQGDLEFLQTYYQTVGFEPDPEEIRWLLTQRLDGPVLLWLSKTFQKFRAGHRPAFDVLDRDSDATLSKEEIEMADESFRQADQNRDDVIDVVEIETFAKKSRRPPDPDAGQLLIATPNAANSTSVYQTLLHKYREDDSESIPDELQRFDTNSNFRFDEDEISAIDAMSPDMELSVDFDTQDPTKSSVAITRVIDSLVESLSAPMTTSGTITLSIQGVPISFSAIQSGASDQVSIGAVSDGYPMLPQLDPNDDGRLTVREMRELVARVKAFDADGDGTITFSETPSTIRLCFALGPVVHRELAGLRRSQIRPETPLLAPPEWFVRMDRNQDQDLTRSEFPGDEEQFSQLDADGDDLVSATEAIAYEKKQTSVPENTGSEKTGPENTGPENTGSENTAPEKANL